MKNKIRIIISTCLIIIGIIVFLYPDIRGYKIKEDTIRIEQKYNIPNTEIDKDALSSFLSLFNKNDNSEILDINTKYPNLLKDMKEYNKNLLENGQYINDAWDYEQSPINLSELDTDDTSIGAIYIPRMSVVLPLYIGASEENMAKGAAVMGQTSMPIGGIGTNSVIVGHRGYKGFPYFKDIELLKEGDLIYINNPWNRLVYKVSEIKVIEPNDIDSIKIQTDKDMITLLTCHPYMSHGKFRYLVFCERINYDSNVPMKANYNEIENKSSKNSNYVSNQLMSYENNSEQLIKIENTTRRILALFLLISLIFMLIKNCKKNE